MVRLPRDSVEKDVEAGKYIDYTLSRRGTSYACITQTGIKEVMQKVGILNSVPHIEKSKRQKEKERIKNRQVCIFSRSQGWRISDFNDKTVKF